MNIGELKNVRRCERCNHLIPADSKVCPYCNELFAYKEPKMKEDNSNLLYS